MPRLNTGCRAAGGTLSESHEPQMRTWVIGPVALQRKSLARTFGAVDSTSQPLRLESVFCSHLLVSRVVVTFVVVMISNARSMLLVPYGWIRRMSLQLAA